jgi:hypothetical protein
MEHRLGMFENRILRRIFESKREEVIGGWRKLHDEELYNLNSLNITSSIKIRRGRREGHGARIGE